MTYAEIGDASALKRLDAILSEATQPKWYRHLLRSLDAQEPAGMSWENHALS